MPLVVDLEYNKSSIFRTIKLPNRSIILYTELNT
jgi:hypothetical protein